MADVGQAAGSLAPKRRRWSLGWTCGLLAAVPLVACAIAAVAVRAVVPASDVVRGFEPSPMMAAIGLACAALHATWFASRLERLRRDKGGVIGVRARPAWAIASRAQAVLAAAIVCGPVFGLVAYQVGDLVNVAADRSEYAFATVEAKEHVLSWRCAWRLRASGPDMASGTSICVDSAMWQRVAVGNDLALVKFTSAAGTQIQWAPESPAGGRHD
jgi:hypothetical protein